MTELYIGLMSGTSLDGIDAALVKFDTDNIELVDFLYSPFSDTLKKEIQQLCQADSPIYLKQYGSIDAQLGKLFATSVKHLLKKTNTPHTAVTAIGSHGQTVYHAPSEPSAFSLQIGDPNIIAELTGISTVADFRRRDIAAKGQGAPLVPAFHQAVFSSIFDLSRQQISIVNIGGIANISYLTKNQTIGFDTGPGNTLMDFWTQKHHNKDYDECGRWAKAGTVDLKLLAHLKQDLYFKAKPPKSTGREYFSADWLNHKLADFSQCDAKDIQASLCQLTAETITDAIQKYAPLTDHTLICGGGVHNKTLLEIINKKLNHPVLSTTEYGINPDHVEAMAFAWLARQTINNLPGNLSQVTGAKKAVILGGVYPGKREID